jgi:nitrite reductase/ring-hydroxylating ferredoxin subunit/uncharacterized membrane protein
MSAHAGSESDRRAEVPGAWTVRGWTEPAIHALGRSAWLNALGKQASNAFHRVVGPGKVKDVLAGTWMAHPMHPMLTDVTIGAWTSAALLDVLGGERARPGADLLVGAGIVSAIPTALSGLSDLTDIVDREERSVGTAHALGNVGALALWSLSYLARRAGNRRAGTALSMAGAAVVTATGFLGGHLSYRRGVGVDQTTFEPRFKQWTAVMDEADLKHGRPQRVMVSGTNIFLYATGHGIRALANRCSHRGGPLHKGSVDEISVTCPWHLSTFRLQDGTVLRGPATAPQPSYDVRVRDGRIEIRDRGLADASS